MVTGTDETKTKTADPTPKGQDSPKGDGSNSTTPKTYTETEYRKAIEDAIAQYGDRVRKEKIDPIAKERDSFKSQAEQAARAAEEAKAAHEETKGRIADLESDLEQAISGNADLVDINKIKKDLRAARDQGAKELKAAKDAVAAEKKALDTERETLAEPAGEIILGTFEIDTFEVAEDYGGDHKRLKDSCIKAGLGNKELKFATPEGRRQRLEEIKSWAEILWPKQLANNSDKKPIVADSGATNGGGVNWDSLTPAQRREEVAKRMRSKS